MSSYGQDMSVGSAETDSLEICTPGLRRHCLHSGLLKTHILQSSLMLVTFSSDHTLQRQSSRLATLMYIASEFTASSIVLATADRVLELYSF